MSTEENINNIIQGHYDNNLNQTGRKQADILGHRLKELNIDFDSVYCSDLKRCQQTLAIINEVVDLGDTVITPLLRERNYGKWTNKCFTQDQGNSSVIEVSDNGSGNVSKTKKGFFSRFGKQAAKEGAETGTKKVAKFGLRKLLGKLFGPVVNFLVDLSFGEKLERALAGAAGFAGGSALVA